MEKSVDSMLPKPMDKRCIESIWQNINKHPMVIEPVAILVFKHVKRHLQVARNFDRLLRRRGRSQNTHRTVEPAHPGLLSHTLVEFFFRLDHTHERISLRCAGSECCPVRFTGNKNSPHNAADCSKERDSLQKCCKTTRLFSLKRSLGIFLYALLPRIAKRRIEDNLHSRFIGILEFTEHVRHIVERIILHIFVSANRKNVLLMELHVIPNEG